MKVISGRSEVYSRKGMVACSQSLASQIGLSILQSGGSAIDAAIATNAALSLMEPHMCGPGGDLFAIIWDQSKQELSGLNANGASPASLGYDKLRETLRSGNTNEIPADSILSVSVPGAVRGWFTLHERFGRLPMRQLLEPAIYYAEKGFPVTPVIAAEWQEFSGMVHNKQPGDFKQVYSPDGATPKQGEIFTNPALANTFRRLAEDGVSAFYQGEIGQRIADFMQKHGGYLTQDDLQTHDSEWITPVSVNYRGYEIFELPPVGQGIAALQMLQIIEQEELSAKGFLHVDTVHLMLEAKKLAFEDRAKYYADARFVDIDIESLISEKYARQRRKLIQNNAAMTVRAGPDSLRRGDTVYLTTADADGNMVSFIQSIYYPFGSGLVVPETGFALQNRGLLFSMDQKHANVYEPGKRPFHTIIPAFVMKQDKPWMSFGVMGGDMQPQGHVQILTNLIDFNMTLQQAGDAPRWRHYGSTDPVDPHDKFLDDGGTVLVEPEFPDTVVKELSKRGHKVQRATAGFGGYQAIRKLENNIYEGASERRKDGQAVGY